MSQLPVLSDSGVELCSTDSREPALSEVEGAAVPTWESRELNYRQRLP